MGRMGMMGRGGLAESLDLGDCQYSPWGDRAKRMRSGLLQLKISHIFPRNSINFLTISLISSYGFSIRDQLIHPPCSNFWFDFWLE